MTTFAEMEAHLLADEKPSIYFNQLRERGFLEKEPFPMLGVLAKIPQPPQHHPEGSVWNHTMLVLDNAGERKHLSQNPRAFMWAALLHDLGKASSTRMRKGRITSYDHDKLGEKLAEKFLKEFTTDEEFIRRVGKLVRWHMQILFVVKGLPFADIKKMSAEVSIQEVALLGLCDRLGRGNMTRDKKLDVEKSIVRFLEECDKYLQRKV